MPTVGVAMLAIFLASFVADRQHAWEIKNTTANAHVFEQTPLGLRVKSTPQQIELFWNHDSSVIRDAEKASIQIWDGEVTEEVPFDAGQLQDGALVYKPQTNDVNIRMEVHERDGQQVSESLRTVAIP